MPSNNQPTAPTVFEQRFLSESQWRVYITLHDYAQLHFDYRADEEGAFLKPRSYPLIAGPTGSGKSMLVEQVAKEIGANYLRLTYGEWIPMGARDAASSTMVQLGRLLSTSSRLVVHLDELDKFVVSDREWGRSVMTDLWNLLDGIVPWGMVMMADMSRAIEKHVLGPAMQSVPKPIYGGTDRMWIVGSGTWQRVFEERTARSIGFYPKGSANAASDMASIADAIRESKVLPTELSGRFAADLLILAYPTRADTERMLEITGLNALAATMGVGIDPEDVDYHIAGMRALESLKTRLLLERIRQHRNEPPSGLLDDLTPVTGPPA